jgi:phosphatidylserine/phosphatidylglycerophosphate/cardiolipin synthase-like enzyme/S1-C subfamily serine protease
MLSVIKNPQLESLRETKRTKNQIVDKIASASEEDLQTMADKVMPREEQRIDHKKILESAHAFLNNDVPPVFTDKTTEAIILALGRPVYLIKNGRPILSGLELDKWSSGFDNAFKNFNLGTAIKSVGRIETKNLPGYQWLGTGWLISDDLIVTNRHVASEFVERMGTQLRFRSYFSGPVEGRIDFLAEHENEDAAEFRLLRCLYVARSNEPDVAIFQIDWDNGNDGYKPLSLSSIKPSFREDVVVIGYPAQDSRVTLVKDMERIYEGIYDVKRIAPGEITNYWPEKNLVEHDATTLGGCSGSLIFSLETGKVMGLHFAGLEKRGNYGVNPEILKKIVNSLPKRVFSVDAPKDPSIDPMLSSELVGRNCKLEPYSKIQVPEFNVSGRLIAYASPDSTYAVTKRLFDKAKTSILIGIYDLSAEHMVSAILGALERGVEVSLMLDIDSEEERKVFNKLKRLGVLCVPAPSCASKNVSYFSSSHEKVIVIDNKWVLVQSGNYSNNSIPLNELDGEEGDGFRFGNRDMGIAIESSELARFFSKILRSDMKLELNEERIAETIDVPLEDFELLLEAPKSIPDPLFPSKTFNFSHRVKVSPILSPDNYMDVIPDLLSSATTSVCIEQQYIRLNQPGIKSLLESIPSNIEVQIIVARPIGGGEKFEKEMEAIRQINEIYGFETRILSPRHFVHCHNKLIIVDNEKVLISSQNWSDSAVIKNREAGVLIHNREIAEYYARIFQADWSMSDESLEETVSPYITNTLESFGTGGRFVRVNASDIQEV